MNRGLTLLVALLALPLLMPACSPGTPGMQGATVEVSCDDFMKNSHLSRQVNVTAGSTITLSLCSNPSTGFEWSRDARISGSSVIQQVDHAYQEPGARGTVGAAGKEVWTFKALKQGTCTVSLEYSRPWQGGEKGQWTYTLTIVVK